MAEIAGLTLITPTSVAGSGVSLSGAKVVFTSATVVTVNGVFSATYANYLMVIRIPTSSTIVLHARLSASGSAAAGANYAWQEFRATDTSITGERQTGQTLLRIGGATADVAQNGAHVYFYGPALAQPTAVRSVVVRSDSGGRIVDNSNTHSLSTSYDGVAVFPSTGSITGALTIYGLSQ